MDSSLFPKQEQWLTGEESSDVRLTKALHHTIKNLSTESIKIFHSTALLINPRINKEHYAQNVNFTLKALVSLLNSSEPIDHLWEKYRGNYHLKELVKITDKEILREFEQLIVRKKIRYNNQLDFSISSNRDSEFNPFLSHRLPLSSMTLSIRVIFKEFKDHLKNLKFKQDDSLFYYLQDSSKAYSINNEFIIWSDSGEVYGLIKSHTF